MVHRRKMKKELSPHPEMADIEIPQPWVVINRSLLKGLLCLRPRYIYPKILPIDMMHMAILQNDSWNTRK